MKQGDVCIFKGEILVPTEEGWWESKKAFGSYTFVGVKNDVYCFEFYEIKGLSNKTFEVGFSKGHYEELVKNGIITKKS